MKRVIVTSGWGAGYPEGGGMQWLNLHYLAGLRALGVEPFWLDMMGPSKKTEELIGAFRARCERCGRAATHGKIRASINATPRACRVRKGIMTSSSFGPLLIRGIGAQAGSVRGRRRNCLSSYPLTASGWSQHSSRSKAWGFRCRPRRP